THRRWNDLRALLRPGPLALGLIVASSWYVASYLTGYSQNPRYQLAVENYGRFVGALGTMPPWFYIDRAFLQSPIIGALAMIAVLLVLAPSLPFARRLRDPSNPRAQLTIELLAAFWAVTFIFFSIAAYKSRVYLLPLCPSAAILVAWTVDRAAENRWGTRLRAAYVIACVALVVGIFFRVPYTAKIACDGREPKLAAQRVNEVVPRDQPLFLFGFYQWAYELQFHLDRDAPFLRRDVAKRPGTYIVLPAERWEALAKRLPPSDPVLIYTATDPKVVVIRIRERPPTARMESQSVRRCGAGKLQRRGVSAA
ncbi:MAG: hypothetical protein ACREQB_02205, partial [Candidatus Binataceae bacterium]